MKYFLSVFLLLVLCAVMHGQVIQPLGPTTFCAGGNVVLSINPATPGSYQWMNAAGNINGATGATYTASASGSYKVIIINGAVRDTLNPITVTVNPLPATPTFTFTTNGQCANIPFDFSVTAPIAGVTYSWDFGDASASINGNNVTHTFNSAIGNLTSTFNVKVKATTGAGCSATSAGQNVSVTQQPSAVLSDFINKPQFTNCVSTSTSTDFTLTVDNSTTTSGTNTQYDIDWGDNSTPFTAASFVNTTHTYLTLGYFTITYTVTGLNGCKAISKYTVYNGSNPGIGLSSNGSTILQCIPAVDTFFISNTSNNPPGTTYTVSFNDGSPSMLFAHPPPPSFVHSFNNSSCGAAGGITPNTFFVRIRAQNPCGFLDGAVEPITTITRPTASFAISPDSIACINNTVTFSNTSIAGVVVQNNGVCDANSISNWVITPSTGWSIVNGTLGNANPTNNPATWGSSSLGVKFNVAGTYSVKLIVRNNSVIGTSCRIDSIVKTVCITTPPTPSFNLSNPTGCAPFNVTATNNTTSLNACKAPTYLWSVAYTPAFCGTIGSWNFTNPTSSTSTNASFNFTNPGKYTITLEVTNACGTFPVSQTVDVKKPPTVTITPPTYPCGPVSITPVANVTQCGTQALTYAWTFAGGVPATSSAANPGSVSFSGVGAHAITLDVTNECGTTTATATVTVTAAPDVVKPADQSLCGGLAIQPVNFTSTVGMPAYNWTNNNPSIGLPPSGTGNIAAFTAMNSGATPVVATITVTPFVNALCSGIPVTFTITVNPRPLIPTGTLSYNYCLNSPAQTLSANTAAGNTLTWYNNPALTGGTATAPTPSTAIANTTLYYVTQTNSFNCASAPAIITVNVNPAVINDTIATDQNICSNTTPATISNAAIISGGNGNYNYQWQSSINSGATWTNIVTATGSSYSPPALLATTQYRRIVTSIPCADTSNTVTITVQGALANYNIAANAIICEADIPALLTGQLPTGGGGSYIYTWESSTDHINWNTVGNNSPDHQPPALLQTTYYRRQVKASQCSAVSNEVTITVNPKPNGTISAVDTSICEYDPGIITFSSTAGTAPFNIEISVTSPSGVSIQSFPINSNAPVNLTVIQPNSSPGNYTIVLTKITDAKACQSSGALSTTNIIVKPKPLLVSSASPTICSGTTTTLSVSGAAIYAWSPSTGLSSTTGSTVTASPTITTTYTIRGTQNSCYADTGITVTVNPGATIANAGPSQILCSVTNTTLAGNVPTVGSGVWSQTSGAPAIITDATLNNTTITGLTSGQRYIFKWTITGFAACPLTSSTDTIDVFTPIINAIGNDTIICLGQPVTIQTQSLSGGNTNGLSSLYTYQWESSANGTTNWQVLLGEIQENLSDSPLSSTCYRRKVTSNGFCAATSNVICITVNPTIANNTIAGTPQVCVNIVPAIITGTLPTGGDNNYIYQWQTSIDGINWSNIGNNINYQPPAFPLAGIHYYRRNVTSGNCTSVSNTFTVNVRPDSKALFTAGNLVSCAPFDLSSVITVAALPDSNGLYKWYADGVLFGSNSTGVFPGYTIINSGDTVIIKLITTSQYGCKPDSIEKQFVTVITAQAKFTKDTSADCGPLTVSFTNASSILSNAIQYFWDFGNGITSTVVQPAAVIFKSSPFFTDTTYQVSLKVYNGCDTTIWRDSIKVNANPKARFGVDTTFGCSPFTVQIDNNSPGTNTYYWDFGNGDKDTTFSAGIFNYTYNIGNRVDTFTIRLIAENQCRRDTQMIDVRVAPNIIRPLINVNSSQLFGCAPHTISFNNNTSGATGFTWHFDDNTLPVITNNSQTTIVHTYNNAGVYNISIDITNGCSDTTVYRQVTVYDKPVAGFTTNASIYCAGDTVRVTNNSQKSTNYQWFWGDGAVSAGSAPAHVYKVPGSFNILLHAERTNVNGIVCMDTLAVPITVLARPSVVVQSNIKAVNCAPFTLNVSAPGIINENVTWYFNDSTVTPSVITANGISAQYLFNKPGTFSVKIIATNSLGCADSATISFTVRGKAIASFTPGDLQVCSRDTTIAYLNTSTYNGADAVSYRWLVDNVFISSNGNFTHRYIVPAATALPKTFNTWLIASNTVGCSDTARAALQVNPTAKAGFSISNPNGCIPYIPTIVNSSANATSYKWLLNGSLVSTSATPAIAIMQASFLYKITLIADNVFGCKPDTFSVNFTSRARPNAAFRLNDTLGCTGILNVITTNLTIGATSYNWNWGDGSNNSSFINSTHSYTTPGQYLITLVASDGVCTDTTGQWVKVSLRTKVDFSVDQSLTCDTARVQFTNLTVNGNSYVWSFGDGTTSTIVDPFKLYPPRIAPYTVKLVASSSLGCKDSLIKANTILAKLPPLSDFFISPSPVITVPNYTFNFNNLTINSSNYKYLWSLGDGSFSTARDVTHKYVDTGNYTVRLIVLDTISNCTDTTQKIARIDGYPGYLYVPNAICPACIQSNLREFLPKGAGLKEYRLQILTTWGELVFETKALDNKGAPSQSWDGKFKGTIVQQDVYIWRIDAKFLNESEWLGMIYPGESKYKKAGTITVIK